MIGCEYFNSGNGSWLFNSVDAISVMFTASGAQGIVQAMTSLSYVSKVEVTVMKIA